MSRVKGDKYNRKYCKQLKNGLRADGKSIPEVCQIWGISKTTYYNWVEQHPEFKAAHEFGNGDCACWWAKLARDVAEGKKKGNAGIICFAQKNIEGIEWKDKVETVYAGEEQIQRINIQILPPPQQQLTHIIEHEDDDE